MIGRRARFALGAALALLACSAQAAERVLHRSGTDDPATIDPHKIAYPGESTIMSDLFVGLTALDRHAAPEPGCAESWTLSGDGKVYVFTLRKGLTWSDGAPLDARDFEYSLRRALDPATAFPYASRLYAIRNARAAASGQVPTRSLGVTALDERRLRIELEHPAPYLLEILATYAMPVPRGRIERFGAEWIRGGNFVNNGPFTLERWVPNGFVRLKRNPRYFDASNVSLDAVVHYPVAQPTTALRRFAAGELDLVLVVPPDQAERARREFGAAYKFHRGLGVEVLVFNTRAGPTRDARVRRALSLAIDREALAGKVLGDLSLAAHRYVSPDVRHFTATSRAPAPGGATARRAAIAEALAAAGHGPGRPLRVRLSFPANDVNRRIAVVIAAMWKAAGIESTLEAKEQRALIADATAGEFEALRTLWLAGHSDPIAFLERLDGAASRSSMNQAGYANPAFDALLRQADHTVDLAQRATLLGRAESLALADQPVAPLHWYVGRRLVSKRVTGWTDNRRGIYLSRHLGVMAR